MPYRFLNDGPTDSMMHSLVPTFRMRYDAINEGKLPISAYCSRTFTAQHELEVSQQAYREHCSAPAAALSSRGYYAPSHLANSPVRSPPEPTRATFILEIVKRVIFYHRHYSIIQSLRLICGGCSPRSHDKRVLDRAISF